MTDSNLKALFRPLRRLRLVLQVWPDPNEESIDDMITMVVDDMRETFQTGFLKQVLAGARELGVLKLALPHPGLIDSNHENPLNGFFSLRKVLDDVTYSHLYETSLSRAKVEPDHLASLLLRHKAALRRLYLADLQLVESMSWLDVFAKFTGQLPNLRKVKLRASCTDSEFETEFDFDIPGMESRRIFPARDAVENSSSRGASPCEFGRTV